MTPRPPRPPVQPVGDPLAYIRHLPHAEQLAALEQDPEPDVDVYGRDDPEARL